MHPSLRVHLYNLAGAATRPLLTSTCAISVPELPKITQRVPIRVLKLSGSLEE